MLSREDNQILTRVDAESPGGQLLRRYWQPVAAAVELTDEKPIKKVKILGEDLVVYRDKSGRYGLVGEHCPHRSASLAYGRVDAEGIRCPYHGWKFNAAGRCIEQPAEPKNSNYKDEIEHPGYPVQKLGGLIWTYMGPAPVPLLPRWDCLAREDGKRVVYVESIMECNWLQPMENSVDPSHLYWLHGYRYGSGHLIDPVQIAKREAQYAEKHEFIPFEYGIMKRRITPNGTDEHPLLFPCALRHVSGERGKANPLYRHNIQIRVPMDDTHTRVYRVNFIPMPGVTSPADADAPWELRPLKYVDQFEGDRQLPMDIPMTKYDVSIVGAQDSMAWETQGPITDRTREHLGHADKGIVMFRRMLREQIEVVQKGGEPLGVIRDPAKNKLIDIPVINERIGLVRQAAE